MAATSVNVPNVRESVTKARKEISAQEDSIKRVSDEIDFMEDAWDSPAQREYTNKFRTTRAEMDKFNQSVKEYLRMMETFVNDCADVDTAVGSSLQGISW
jgi:uncharacterized protein YukE